MRFLIPRLSDLTETQYRLFLLAQAIVVRHARAALPAPNDADIADAVASVAATLETAGKGIIYEHRAASIPAQRIAGEVSSAIGDLVKRVGADGARLERDAAKALRASGALGAGGASGDARCHAPGGLVVDARGEDYGWHGGRPGAWSSGVGCSEAGPKLVI